MFLRRRLRGRGLASRADESMANLGGGPVVAIAIYIFFFLYKIRDELYVGF